MKRLISLLLSVVLLFGFVATAVTSVSAASNYVASDEMVELLKEMEGFDLYPRWDYRQWTVGYGTACPAEDLERYQAYGITEQEADALLRKNLEAFGKSVNSFNDKYELNMTQNQFDAILLFTYNMGHAWMFQEGSFRTSLINGETGNDLMFTMGKWSHAGGKLLTALVKRRLMEFNMFVNGVYSRELPDNFCYVVYEMNGGEGETDVQCYDSDLTDVPRVIPTKEGYTFAGWYTTDEGGQKITVLDASVKNCTLYARWVPEGEEVDQEQEETKLPVTVTVTAKDVNVRKGPGTSHEIVCQLPKGEEIVITDVRTNGSLMWGKFDKGWICLTYTTYDQVIKQESEESTDPEEETEAMSVAVTVTATNVNVRKGPGTNYGIVCKVTVGDKLVITDVQTGSGYTWGKSEKGWIVLKYTDYEDVLKQEQEKEPSVEDNEPEETVPEETVPEETVPEETVPEETQPEETEPEATEPPVTEPEETEPEETEPEETQPPVTEPEEPEETEPEITTVMGTVTGSDLRIRKGAGTSYAVVGFLQIGDRVEILEQKTVGSMVWGRIDKGWISLTYVKLDEPVAEEPEVTEPAEPEETTPPTTEPEPTEPEETAPPTTEPEPTEPEETTPPATEPEETKKVTGTVKVNEFLRIRSGAGTGYAVVGYLTNGTKVEILETKMVSGINWGRIDKGWISLAYVVLDQTQEESEETAEPETKIMTVTADCLRIRSGAGTSYKIVGYLYQGAKVQVLETKNVNGTVWARIDKGWVSMDYLK